MSVFDWLDARVGLRALKRALLDREVPDRLTWWHTLGSATLTVFVVQVVTGIVLATFYSPSPDHAYSSIEYIQRQVTSGSLLRGIHHWAASAMVILVLAHMIRVFSMGAYKYPREVNWLLGVALFIVVLGFSFTGYLLPWDQKAYWATAVGTSIAGTTPVIGSAVVSILRGGGELGAATLSRFYAFHVLWLPGLLGLVLLLHLALVVKQGIAPRTQALEEGAPPRTDDPAYPGYYRDAYAATKHTGTRFYPDIIGKDAVVSTLVVVLIVLMALKRGAPLEPPADPTDTAYAPTPEWYFLPLYQLLKLVPGSFESLVAVGIPTVLFVVMIALPLFDRRSTRSLAHRPLALVSLTTILVGAGFLLGAAVKEAGPAIPPEVGRPLTSAERAGRALYHSQKCDDCHKIAGLGGKKGPDLTEEGLHHSPAWLHSYIEAPTRFRGDTIEMPTFGPPTLSHQEIEELAQYVSSLRGKAGPNVQPEYHDTFPPVPEVER
ncbi:MAG TPA: cytochrome b N-terminal domain-containing protein [Gemmatimonadales bacterium]|nr:cytochrome b N-terminal domain-containing protein [Gemmatimonadales bacterium]